MSPCKELSRVPGHSNVSSAYFYFVNHLASKVFRSSVLRSGFSIGKGTGHAEESREEGKNSAVLSIPG